MPPGFRERRFKVRGRRFFNREDLFGAREHLFESPERLFDSPGRLFVSQERFFRSREDRFGFRERRFGTRGRVFKPFEQRWSQQSPGAFGSSTGFGALETTFSINILFKAFHAAGLVPIVPVSYVHMHYFTF